MSVWATAASSDRESWAVPAGLAVSAAGWGTSGRESDSADQPQPLERLRGRGCRPGSLPIRPSFQAPYVSSRDVASRSRCLTDSVSALG